MADRISAAPCRAGGVSFQGIRIIKLFAWERDFMSKIDKSRRNEMRSLRSYMVSPIGVAVSELDPTRLSSAHSVQIASIRKLNLSRCGVMEVQFLMSTLWCVMVQ